MKKAISNIRYFSGKVSKPIIPRVCIVGAGPAGFYAGQQLIKLLDNVHVDIIERLPVPFGLVRYGVAPDHPEVKNVVNTFHKTAINPRVKFLGNINVGKDVTINELKENYHVVVLTYGAEEDKKLNIPGENLKNVISGKNFVGWYNGLPSDKNLKIDFDSEEAVILGQGNVAIDIARILLTPIDELKTTDITSHALDQLSQSRVRKVWLIGRRGPLQAAFTIAELREMTKLKNCSISWRPEDFKSIREVIPNLPRPRKRLTELMLRNLEENSVKLEKTFAPIFFRGPKEIIGTDSAEKILLTVNKLKGDDIINQKAVPTDSVEEIPCSLIFRSIGYKSVPIDNSLPFNSNKGCVINTSGKVDKHLYAAGWVATGPIGVILSTMTNAFQVGSLISTELDESQSKPGTEGLLNLLKQKNIPIITYKNWQKIDQVEQERGKVTGKPREKITGIEEMIKVALS